MSEINTYCYSALKAIPIKYVEGLPAFHSPVSMCGPAKGPVHAPCSSSGMMVEFLAVAMEMEQVNIRSEELGNQGQSWKPAPPSTASRKHSAFEKSLKKSAYLCPV